MHSYITKNLFFILGLAACLNSTMFPAAHRREPEVRCAIFSRINNIDYLLLAHNKQFNSWNVFNAPARLNLSALTVAYNQSNRVLNDCILAQGFPCEYNKFIDSATGDSYIVYIFNCFPVDEQTLNTQCINEYRDNFKYVPIHLLLSLNQPILHVCHDRMVSNKIGTATKPMKLSESMLHFVQENWSLLQNWILLYINSLHTQVNSHNMTLPLQQPTTRSTACSAVTWAEYKEMLVEICQADDTWSLKDRGFYSNESKTEEIFNTLKPHLELSMEAMKQYQKTYNVIVHRQPHHDTLIVGCGNILPYREGFFVFFIDNYGGPAPIYRAKHAHTNCDTIDPDFARNPTIVGGFGYTDITPIFNGHRYKRIILEGIRVGDSPYAIQLLHNLLDDNGYVFTNYGGPENPISKKALAESSHLL